MESKTLMRTLASIAAIALLASVAAWAEGRPDSVLDERGTPRVQVLERKDHPVGPVEIPPPIQVKPIHQFGGGSGGTHLFSFSSVPLAGGASGSSATDRIGASLKKAAEELR